MKTLLRRELFRYALVGGVSVAIDCVAYYGIQRLGWMDAVWAKRVSFALGAVWGFFANKFFTFGTQGYNAKEPLLFIFVYIAGWFLNSTVHNVLLSITGLKWAALLVATSVSIVANYGGQKWIVFRTTNANGGGRG